MAKRDETGELIIKPERRFPWRLWLYAIIVTAAAGAGGYFTWHYRGQAINAVNDRADCTTNLGKLQAVASDTAKVSADSAKKATECKTSFDAEVAKNKGLEGQLLQLSTNLNASKEELATLRTQRAEAEKRIAAMEDIQKQFAKMIDAGQLEVTSRRGSLVLSLPSEVLFASGKADVSEKGTIAVIEIGVTLKKLGDRRFMVLGHTDDQALKSAEFADNWELSTARALNVTRTLVKAGMEAGNLIPAGAGSNDPLGKDRAKNRRIEIVLLPAISELPPLPASIEGGDGGAAKPAAPKTGEAPKPAEAPKPVAPAKG